MNNRYLAAGLAALVLATAACSDDDSNGPGPRAQVRVVHASPDAPAVDVLVDNQSVLTGVAYKGFSGFLSVAAGSRNIKVNAAGSSTTVINADLTLTKDSAYTVIATDLVANITPLVLADDLSDPAAGSFKLRLVHGAPNVGLVDIYITAPGADISGVAPDLAGVGFQVASGYIEAPAGQYQVRITPAGSKTPALDTGALTLGAGQIRTAIAVEAVGGGVPLAALLLADKN